MSIEKVREYFKKFQIENRIQEFPVSSATVELAAKALGCEAARIAKSLSFIVDDRPILVITAGDTRVDNAKFRDFFKSKAKMIKPDEVKQYIGHDIGGVCPFGVNKNVDIFLDISMRRFKTVFPACGSSNSAIELTIDELEKYSSFSQWIDVCKINTPNFH